jgi:hypothetical protein
MLFSRKGAKPQRNCGPLLPEISLISRLSALASKKRHLPSKRPFFKIPLRGLLQINQIYTYL